MATVKLWFKIMWWFTETFKMHVFWRDLFINIVNVELSTVDGKYFLIPSMKLAENSPNKSK